MRPIQRKLEPPIFSTKQFVEARANLEAQLADGNVVDFQKFFRLIPKLRNALLEDFDHQCAYCDSTLEASLGHVDHFYPKSLFPEKAFQWLNLILACQVCNIAKGAKFPVSEDGEPLLLYPGFDNPNDHIKELDDGQLVGLTAKGNATITLLQLNRSSLVESRKRERLYRRIVEARPELESALFVNDFYQQFIDGISNIKVLNDANVFAPPADQPLRYMLYANVITCLETYLSDAFINTVKRDQRFVETFHGFKERKFDLTDVFARYESINKEAITAMADVIYHDLAKVSGMYRDTLGVKFPNNIESLYKAVLVRHDIVHRNGKDKSGKFHSISAKEVENLVTQVLAFVTYMQRSLSTIQQH